MVLPNICAYYVNCSRENEARIHTETIKLCFWKKKQQIWKNKKQNTHIDQRLQPDVSTLSGCFSDHIIATSTSLRIATLEPATF
jgi:hypothetical protein